MKNSMSVLSAMFLGVGMAVAVPAFAEGANEAVSLPTLTQQERDDLKKSSSLFSCTANTVVDRVDEIRAANESMSDGDLAIKIQEEVFENKSFVADVKKKCEKEAGFTFAERNEFLNGLDKKYGGKAWDVIENTLLKESELTPHP